MHRLRIDAELVAAAAMLSAALFIGLATAGDYGITVDEFNTDDYGPKALAWYTSGFVDRSHFEEVEDFLWYYGPWFQMLTAAVQSLGLADPLTVRHMMTFVVGLGGLAAVLPIARATVGPWIGFTAISLCLLTGNFYGSLFFASIDVPFLAAMTWATLAIVLMSRTVVPSWLSAIIAGLLTGLAIATRTGGIITHAYLLGAMSLCALERILHSSHFPAHDLFHIAARALCVMAIAWMVAIALWPWLQVGNPFVQFKIALMHFVTLQSSFEFPHWGRQVVTTALPPSYIPGELFARLSEAFVIMLIVGFVVGLIRTAGFIRATIAEISEGGHELKTYSRPCLFFARSRGSVIVWTAAILPIAFLIIQRATLYDGVRHILFVIPMLAIIAGVGALRIIPFLARNAVLAAVGGGAYFACEILTLARLHPLEYVATNAFAGRVAGSYERFELDYWSLAATEALRRLERRLEYASNVFETGRPSILICIGFRQARIGPMLKKPWRIEIEPEKADFTIETERWHCADKTRSTLIDEVKRFDHTFAWTYAREGSLPATRAD